MTSPRKCLKNNLPTFVIIGNINCLTLELADLLKNHYQVVIATNEKRKWVNFIKKNRVGLNNIFFHKIESVSEKLERVDYLLFVDYPTAESEKKNWLGEIKSKLICILDVEKKFQPKTIFLTPLFQNKNTENLISGVNKKINKRSGGSSARLLLGDVFYFSERKKFEFEFNNLIRRITEGREKRITVKRKVFYPTSLEKTSEKAIKAILSLGAYGKSTQIISEEVSLGLITRIIRELNLNVKLSLESDTEKVICKSNEKLLTNEKSKDLISDLIDYYKKRKVKKVKRISKRKKVKSTKKFLTKKKNLLTVFILFLISPYLLITTSFLSLWMGKKSYEGNKFFLANTFFSASKTSSEITKTLTSLIVGVPLVEKVYINTHNFSQILLTLSLVGKRAILFSDNTIELIEGATEEGSFDFNGCVSDMIFDIDFIYEYLNRFQAEKKYLGAVETGLIDFLLDEKIEDNTFDNLLLVKNVFKNISELLGKENKKTYLVLIQDNSVLRPSGGLVKGAAFVDFVDGKIESIEVYEPDYVDENISGFIEFPEPFDKYLNENKWSFKNVGLEFDFSVTSEKAEWFIEKSLKRKVDGVIAVDFDFFKDISQKFDGAFTDDNEGGYLEKFNALNKREKVEFVQIVSDNLKKKHIQVFVHNKNVQTILTDLGFSGTVLKRNCKVKNCYSEVLGLVEANLGSTESTDINREVEVYVSFEKGLIKRHVYYFLENSSDDIYKAYAGVITGEDSSFGKVRIFESGEEKDVEPSVFGKRGLKEAGVYLELESGNAKALIFEIENGTNLDFGKEGMYLFDFVKQAGTNEISFEIKIDMPKGVDLATKPTFSLTETGISIYNTKLFGDFDAQIVWEQAD